MKMTDHSHVMLDMLDVNAEKATLLYVVILVCHFDESFILAEMKFIIIIDT